MICTHYTDDRFDKSLPSLPWGNLGNLCTVGGGGEGPKLFDISIIIGRADICFPQSGSAVKARMLSFVSSLNENQSLISGIRMRSRSRSRSVLQRTALFFEGNAA